ncbi:hypothetical protein ALI22I_02555 [Saccharothrix sp. ALI-22-I]|nr:hypothetical protein ALI22I_02555 [Saccharothrix sp. ALI-22-I]
MDCATVRRFDRARKPPSVTERASTDPATSRVLIVLNRAAAVRALDGCRTGTVHLIAGDVIVGRDFVPPQADDAWLRTAAGCSE